MSPLRILEEHIRLERDKKKAKLSSPPIVLRNVHLLDVVAGAPAAQTSEALLFYNAWLRPQEPYLPRL